MYFYGVTPPPPYNIPVTPLHLSELKLCGDNRTSCVKSTTCVANNAWCDGKLDCPGGEDEEDCNCDTSKEVITHSKEVITHSEEG